MKTRFTDRDGSAIVRGSGGTDSTQMTLPGIHDEDGCGRLSGGCLWWWW